MRAENCLHIKLSCASIQQFVEHQFARTHQVEHQIVHLVEHEARSNKATKVAVLEVCNMASLRLCQPVTMVAVAICCCNSFPEKMGGCLGISSTLDLQLFCSIL